MNITALIENMIPTQKINLQNSKYFRYKDQITVIVKNLIDNGKLYGFSNDMNTIKYFGYFKGNELIIK